MESTGQAAAAPRVDGDRHLPNASPHAQVAVETLRRELLKERIREEIIATERRDSEPEARRGLGDPAGSHRGTSPVRQTDRLRPHMPLSPKLRLGEAIETPGGVVMSGRPVKDRLSGWHRSPWHDRSVNASSSWAGLRKKTFSGVKRKSTAETSVADNENSFEKWSCALCHVNLYSEFSFKEHCAAPPAPVKCSIHGMDKANY